MRASATVLAVFLRLAGSSAHAEGGTGFGPGQSMEPTDALRAARGIKVAEIVPSVRDQIDRHQPIPGILDPAFVQKVEHYASQNPYLASCLGNRSTHGAVVPVYYHAESTCLKSIRSATAAYYVGESHGRIRLMARIDFEYKGRPENKETVVARLGKAKECMADFFASHGILLNLLTRVDSPLRDPAGGDPVIALWDEYPRPDNLNWTMLRTQARGDLRESQSCSLALHEFGHLLGLDDTYPDAECPEREYIGPDDDVMNNHWLGPQNIRLYPRAIEAILKPLCAR